jgi:hypothetical protein
MIQMQYLRMQKVKNMKEVLKMVKSQVLENYNMQIKMSMKETG